MLLWMSLAVMSNADTLSVMNTLLAIVYRSLPMYAHDAQPWRGKGDERAATVLALIVEEQRRLAGRVAEYILDHDGRPDAGDYPLEFSDANWHFVGLEYLLGPLIEHQQIDIERIARCVAELHNDRGARVLAEEALGAAKAHLESLEELVAGPPGTAGPT
jgi:hypothetical protein